MHSLQRDRFLVGLQVVGGPDMAKDDETDKVDDRPPSKQGRQLTMRISPEDLKRLKIYCVQNDLKQHIVAEQAMREFLDRVAPQKE